MVGGVTVRRGRMALIALAGGLGLVPATAAAQDITYKPIDPSFGGNPFNSAHLLGIANAQNDFKDPNSTNQQSIGEIFARQLQSRLLSALSGQLVDAIFGENPQQHGTISFGGQTITFDRGLESVTLDIYDDATGETTTIVVPIYAVAP